MKISIDQAKQIREAIGATRVVVFATDADNDMCVATHGETRINSKEAAIAGNKLKSALGWPESLCRSKPLERLCKNCVYWEPDYGTHCFNGWSKDGTTGFCGAEPKKTTTAQDRTCRFFEPRW